MKRVFFTMIAIWCALSASSNGYTYTDSSGLTWDWRISGNGAILEYTDYGEYDEDPIPCISGAIPSTLTIPSTVKLNNTTYPIIGIGSSAFYHCSNITAVIIPNSVQSIGFFAFDGCTNLVSVHIDNLSAWCNIYFEDNNSNPLYYAHHLFINDEEVTELIIPNDVKAIRSYAFEGLTNLTSVTIPSSVTSIGQYAFAYCTGLTSVKVYRESPLSISSYTFTNRANATLYVPAGSKAAYEAANYWKEFKEIVEMAPVSAISFSDSNVKDICVANWDTNGDGELSEDEAATVTNLGTMFKGNSSITSFNELQYFTGLTSIGEKAFYNCSSLISVTIPENVTSIGDDAFNGCSVLASINIPSSVNSIGARAFTGCSSMSSIHITDLSAWCNISFSSDASNPLNYGHHLFLNGEEITDLVIPSGISLLKSYAFCGGYFSSVTIPSSCLFTNTKCVFAYSHIGSITINQYLASETFIQAQIGNLVIAPEVTSGGTHAFYKTTIDNLEIPYSSVTLGYSYGSNYALFDGCTINKATVNRRISSSSSDSSTMPPFYNYCTIKELHVGSNTWYNADNLCGRVTIDDLYFDGITDISANAFYSTRSGNNNIHNIHLSEEISSIGSYAFYNSCSSLNSVVAEMPSPPVIDSNTFNSRYTRSNATLYVLEGSKAAYEAAEYWQDFIIVEMASSTASVVTAPTPKELTYTGSAQELVTPGEASGGTMQYSLDGMNYSPDIPTGTDVGEYTVYYKVVGDADHSDTEPATVSVTILPSSPAITFADANVKALCVANWDTNGDGELSEAEAAAVTTLGEVFKGNADITSFDELQYFTGLTEIGSHAFADCTSLTSVSLPSTAHKIQEWAFSNTAFTTFVIPDYIEEVATHSFYSCKQLTGIYVGTGLSTIGWKAFATCPVLSQIVVSDNNTNFDSRNESNCIIETETNTLIVGCKNTSIPSTVTNIATVAFEGCWNLTEITLPNGLVEIGELAFSWCYSLTSITIPASVTSIGSNAFENCGGLNSVTVENESPVAIDENTFSNRTNATLYVPSGSKAVYETADYWKEFKEIVEPSPAISFADANVKALCVANWDTNGDGELSEAEAATVTSLGQVFKGNEEITLFDELQYFTGLTEIADYAFNECTKLESVILPSEVTRIGNWAFTTCNSLNTITIPASVTDIGAGAFAGCINMISMTVDTENTVYDSREDCNAIIHSSTNTVVAGCKNMTIPEGVTSIGDWALNGMGSLTSVVLPSSLTSIGTGAFSWCWSLPSITIPANVTSIGGGAFEGCSNLTSVTVENPEPVAIEESSFSNRANATLYVPAGSTVAYKAADYWKEFKEIVEWLNIAVNSDMEGTDDVCFFSRENYPENEEIVPSTIVEGVGVDGSRGIVIQSIDNPSETWDTQFFIRLPQTLPTGTKYHMSFDYKASQEASGSTETHAEPSQYVYWNGIGTINYTADWKHFELIGTVSAEQSPADNPMRTIAFDLAVTPTSTTYYFDNVVFEIDRNQVTPVAIVAEAPTPKELTFTGEAQELINPGEALGGTMQYSLDGTNFSPDIPTGTDAGEYTVYYKVVGDEDHSDSEVATVSVTIAEAMAEETNYLTAADISGIAGGSTSLVISLENEDPIYDIQFKLQLPEGVVVNKNSDNQYKVSYSERLSGLSHEMSYREEGYYTFLIHGMEKPISGNSGPIVTVGLTLSSELAGNYNIEISDIVLTKSDASKVKPRNVDVVLSLTDGQVGDVNRDGDIDVADIRCIANYILGKSNAFFDEDAADANNDGDIDVADIRTIANIILYGSNSSAKEFTDFNNDPQ
jgi:hypothetical protein